MRFRRSIPSPAALFSFEAAARLGSFSLAARELNVSQAAISCAVRKLELHLGVQLFLRQHRSIALTENGRKFYGDVSIGLSHISRSADEFLRMRERAHVTLSASTAFASYWLLPRLVKFRQSFPELELRILTTDQDVDLISESISLGIRRGTGNWANYECMLFAEEEIYAVCSPDYIEKVGPFEKPEDLLGCQLIHLNERFRPRPGWNDWFEAAGVAHYTEEDGLRLNDYALVIRSGLAGQGIILGWKYIVDNLLAEGRLIKAVDYTYRSGFGFYLLWPRTAISLVNVNSVRDWILNEQKACLSAR